MGAALIWLVAALLLGAGELHARGLVLAPLAGAALLAAGASFAGAGVAVSVVVFLALSLTALRMLRPLALRHQRRPAALQTGPAALVGHRAVVVERIANDESVGRIRIEGELWTARSLDDGVVIDAGEVVEVAAIRGATALVMS
ncbi:MAG TPA: NfeD family protein [Solirubrobacteraceae bacterium]|jgi:membrane protein implicated in regulation of membrane protease activity